MVIAKIIQPIVAEVHQSLAFLDMGGQQSRLRNGHLSDSEADETKLEEEEDKTKCWGFPNCHKLRDNLGHHHHHESEVYRPYQSTLNHNHVTHSNKKNDVSQQPQQQLNHSSRHVQTNETADSEKLIDSGAEQRQKAVPSMVTGAIVNTWKSDSMKRPSELSFKSASPRSSAEESTSPLTKTTDSVVHDSTTSLYSDVSSTRASEATPDYLLSEHSQDMLMHIIRCFPFPSPKNSPKTVKREQSKTALHLSHSYGPCETEPSSSEHISPTGKPKRHLFTKHGNPMTSLFYRHHLQQEKRKRTGSSVSDQVNANSSKEHLIDSCSVPATPTTGRPYALSTTSAPGLCNGSSGQDTACPSNGSFSGLRKGALSALCQVSVDTMAITALPLDCWLKERLKNWVQLSGHEGTIVPATNQTLWKKLGSTGIVEAKAYEQITLDKVLDGFTPKFYKEIQHKNESFIEIQDLLADFPNMKTRAVMDIKIGTRTFLESEVANCETRYDLYKKMVDVDAEEPTEQERAEQAITKVRYMQFRERESSSQSMGFRIEAAQLPGGMLQKSFKKVKTQDQIVETLKLFLGERFEQVSQQFEQRLREMRAAIEQSTFFRTHEVVGSSILFIYDEAKTGAWMIDFAKSTKVDENMIMDHRSAWQCGNHEDGYLFGLDNLIEVFARCHSRD